LTQITTANVALDIKPAELFSDERFFRLPKASRAAYLMLQAYAMQLNATTASDYVDGEFSVADALIRVRDLDQFDLDAMLEWGLVAQLDGDRWRVEFTSDQTPHSELQSRADARGSARKLAAERKQEKLHAHQDTTDRQREQWRESKRKQRAAKVDHTADAAPPRQAYCPSCSETTPQVWGNGALRCTQCCGEVTRQKEFEDASVPF